MADEFTTMEGVKVKRSDIVQEKIDYYKAAYEAGQSQITDFNEGSNARNLLESSSIDVYVLRYLIDDLKRTAFPQHARNGYLDLLGVIVNCYREPAAKATGVINFSLSSPKPYDITIPRGAIISTEGLDPVEVQTTEKVTIAAGNTSINANAEALLAGVEGNVAATKLTRLVDPIDEIEAINNADFTGGVDQETDDSFKARILEAGKGGVLGSLYWYKTQTENIEGVHDAAVVNNPLGSEYNILIYVNGDTKPTPDEVVTAVVNHFNQESYQVAGLKVDIEKPTFISQNIEATVTLKDGFVWEDVEAELEANIACYFNGGKTSYQGEDDEGYEGLNIGGDIIRTQLQLIFANTEGVLDYNLTTPAGNVDIATDEAASMGTITLTQV